MRFFFAFYLLVFVLPFFVLAGWMLLVAPQPLWLRVFGGGLIGLTGIWTLMRAWTKIGPGKRPPSD